MHGVWQLCSGNVGPTSESCNGVDDDCDGVVDGPPATDACAVSAHATASECAAGECVVATCAVGFDDCNGVYSDGCETDLGVPTSCGACNTSCSDGNACDLGQCVALPIVRWSANIGFAQGVGSSSMHASTIADDGSVYVGGAFSGEVSVGTLTATASEPVREDLWLAKIDASGTPVWLRGEGQAGGFEAVLALEYSSIDDALYTGGTFAGPATVAGTVIEPACCERGGFFASFAAADGAPRWVTASRGLVGSSIPPASGPFGIDVFSSDASDTALSRFDTDGNETSRMVNELPLFPVRQLPDGRTLVWGNSNDLVDNTCRSAGPFFGRNVSFVGYADVDSGLCTLVKEMPGVFVFHRSVQISATGTILVAGRLVGAFFDPAFPITSDDGETILIALDESGNVRWVARDPDHVDFSVAVATDDRGNVYWMTQTAVTTPALGRLSSFRADGVMRWSVLVGPMRQASAGSELNLTSTPTGELTLFVVADGDVSVGTTVIPGEGFMHRQIIRLGGRIEP